MKRNWTTESAREWVLAVESKKKPRGLKYCSALSFLRIAPDTLSAQTAPEKASEK